MKIAIVTFWYNEEILAPFFLKHYSYVDDIYVYLDKDTNDHTRSICGGCPNTTVRNMSFPDGYDPLTHTDAINKVVKGLKHDWIYSVDADELIQQPKRYANARAFLAKQQKQGHNLVIAKMFQVFRHVTDKNLDITKPVLPQRSHGDPDLNTVFNRCYVKPIVVKSGIDIVWHVGCHNYGKNSRIRVSKEQFFGAHWKMADPQFAVTRRIYHNQARLSKRSKAKGRLWQDTNTTPEKIRRALAKHSHDPDVLSSLLPAEGKDGV